MRGATKRDAAEAAPEIEFLPTGGALMPLADPYYLYTNAAAEIDGIDRVDMGQIRFMLEGEGYRIFPDGHAEPSCPVMINGPGTAAAGYHIDGPFRCFGVSLRPIGCDSILITTRRSRGKNGIAWKTS